MILVLPQTTIYAWHLRSPSVSGGKDWIICVTSTGTYAKFGKTGAVNQTRKVSDCTSKIEAMARMNAKLGEQYRLIDTFDAKTGWATVVQQQQAATQPPKPTRQPPLVAPKQTPPAAPAQPPKPVVKTVFEQTTPDDVWF
jgi:hypothetical protein